MKIAEALVTRGELDTRIKTLTERAKNAARWVEGEEPAETAQELLSELRGLVIARSELIARINMTNAATSLQSGFTLTQAIARRARLSALAKLLNDVADEATPVRDRYYGTRRRTELAEKTTVPVLELRAEANRLAAEHRQLDMQIQQANWNTDLL